VGEHSAQATQVRRPWRSTVRTIFQAVVAAAAAAPGVYSAATHHNADAATGWAAGGLAVAAAVTRVMALPAVETFLQRFVPFLAAEPKTTNPDAQEG
jgi:hypothetical protein